MYSVYRGTIKFLSKPIHRKALTGIRPLTNLAGFSVGLLGHPNVRVVPQACLADDREVGLLPCLLVVASLELVSPLAHVAASKAPAKNAAKKNAPSSLNGQLSPKLLDNTNSARNSSVPRVVHRLILDTSKPTMQCECRVQQVTKVHQVHLALGVHGWNCSTGGRSSAETGFPEYTCVSQYDAGYRGQKCCLLSVACATKFSSYRIYCSVPALRYN